MGTIKAISIAIIHNPYLARPPHWLCSAATAFPAAREEKSLTKINTSRRKKLLFVQQMPKCLSNEKLDVDRVSDHSLNVGLNDHMIVAYAK